MAYAKVGTVGEIPDGHGKQVKAGGKTLAVFNLGGEFRAIDDTCPHRGASLSEGEVHDGAVVCPWHTAAFDLSTGEHLCPPAKSGVKTYPVQVVGDEVQVDV